MPNRTTLRHAGCALLDGRGNKGPEQVLQVGVGVEGLLDPLQEDRADDAPAAPQQGDRAEIQRPLVLRGRRLELHEALGVTANLRGVKGLADLLDELPRSRVACRRAGSTRLARTRASFIADRQRA
jgi:hypothetical protein